MQDRDVAIGAALWRAGGGVRALAFSPDGKLVASLGDELEALKLTDAATGRSVRHLSLRALWGSRRPYAFGGLTGATVRRRAPGLDERDPQGP